MVLGQSESSAYTIRKDQLIFGYKQVKEDMQVNCLQISGKLRPRLGGGVCDLST